ncbi:MAG: ABC transporter ATP-binding protein [bacterium]
MQPILEVEDLRVYFRTIHGDARSVDGISFKLYEKEILGIAGESGCGKSTAVEAILRLIKPPGYIKSGRVLFKGVDLLSLKERELRKIRWKELSYIPQGSMNALNPVLKIREQIVDGLRTHTDLTRQQAGEMVRSALGAVGMPSEVADMYPHELSGGMRQRVCIGMSTSLKPSVVLADEPITALDVIMQRLNLQTIAELRDKFGITILLVAHDMACHAEICDRICVMYAGKMVEVGPVDKVFADPLHPYTRGLLEAVPSLEGRSTKSIPGLAPSPLNWPEGCRFHPRCSHRMDICSKKEPVLREVESGRHVACHLYYDGD